MRNFTAYECTSPVSPSIFRKHKHSLTYAYMCNQRFCQCGVSCGFTPDLNKHIINLSWRCLICSSFHTKSTIFTASTLSDTLQCMCVHRWELSTETCSLFSKAKLFGLEWTLDWTGLDYGLDWTGLDWPKQLYTDSEHHQGYNSLSPALSQVAS